MAIGAMGTPALATGQDVVINEVMFDAPGPAEGHGAWQWVELAAREDGLLDDSWTLRDGTGNLLMQLPELDFPAGTHLVLLLGPKDPGMENLDPDLGTLALASGHPWGDHLGIDGGGVRLHRGNILVDEIHWGQTTQTPRVELSLASGQLLNEGESLGRDAQSTDTDSPGDWATAGGANANGITPGLPNIVELPRRRDLVLFQDDEINALLMGLSLSETNPGWLRVEGTDPRVVFFESQPQAGTVKIQVEHSFQLQVNGSAQTLLGLVETTFQRQTASLNVSESYATSGTLYSPNGDLGLRLKITKDYAGAHGLTQTMGYFTDYAWIEGSMEYPVTVTGSADTSWVSPTVQRLVDAREVQDFGGPVTKVARNELLRTRTGDGAYELTSTLTRTFPNLLPKPGNHQMLPAVQTERLLQDFTYVRDPLGGASDLRIIRHEQYVDDVLHARLRDGAVGTASFSQVPLSEEATAFGFEMSLPLERGNGTPYEQGLSSTAVHTETLEKELTEFTVQHTTGGQSPWTLSGAIDPPVSAPQVQGCPQCAAAAKAKAKARRKKLWKKVKQAGLTTATCSGASAGAVITTDTIAGRRAAIKMLGKAGAKRLVPGVGWIITGFCGAQAIGDWIWGD